MITAAAVGQDEARRYLRQSGLRLARLSRKYFGITGRDEDLTVDRQPTRQDVEGFLTEYRASIRPETIADVKILPAAGATLRTLLWGPPLPNAVLNDVVRLSLYADEILVLDPFSSLFVRGSLHPKPESPHVQPEQWIEQLVNYALLVCALEPWLEAGLVLLFPRARNFATNPPAFDAMALDAAARGVLTVDGPEATQDMLEFVALIAHNELELSLLIGQTFPEIPDSDRPEVVSALMAFRRAHPIRYNEPRRSGASITASGSGQNIFEATWVADRTGAYVVPRTATERRLYRQVARMTPGTDSEDALVAAFASAPLPMLNNVSLRDALALRKTQRLQRLRTYLHEVWSAVSDANAGAPKSRERERELADRLAGEYAAAHDEWTAIYKDLGITGATTAAISLFGSPLAQVINAGIVPIIGASAWFYKTWAGSARTFRHKPSALLVQLENEAHPNPLRRIAAAIERRI